MKEKINLCVIGMGQVGGLRNCNNDYPDSPAIITHCRAAYEAKKKGLIDKFYVCDNERTKIFKAYTKWNASQGFTSIFNIKDKVDIFVIATPTNTHYKILENILKLKKLPKLVICEKPFTGSLKEANDIKKEYDKRKIPIVINYVRNYCDEITDLAISLRNGFEGKIISANLKYTRGLIRDGSHGIDLFNLFFGQFKTGKILNTKGFNDYSEDDLTYPVYLQYQLCDNVFMIPFDGRKYSIFEMEILTERWKIVLTDHSRKIFYYPAMAEKIYGNFKSMSSTYDIQLHNEVENSIYRTLLNSINYIVNKKTKLMCTAENAIKVHEVLDKLLDGEVNYE